ncbi:hypothetical protein PVIIG_05729 [Plasmodium vivax India VII]|uniref:VIR protein n=1 Tax=Plasmodium vivax India VII TaxID=1077284 RepID=A0A0J9S1Q2_PLAVI|nr:hypothetical protein PVIIG_05729 [Plasmodium vivax India VII]
MALSPENNWEKNLPDLPSYKKYTELDNVNISGDDNDYCKKSLESSEEGDKKFCNKIAKNLSILKNEKDTQKRTYNCYYFNHWLYDNIGKKYYDGNTEGKKVKVSEKLLDFVSLANSEHILIPSCKGNIYGKPEEWKEEKDLHDYFENHKDIKCNSSDKSKCEKYVNYVTYIKTLYEDKKEDCCEDDVLYEYGYCEPYFKCENKYNPQNLLTELKKELQELGKKAEAPRDGGTGAVEAGKAPGSGGDEREKKAQVDEVAAVTTGKESKEKLVDGKLPKEKSADSPAQSAPEKNLPAKPEVTEPAGAKPGGSESREETTASAKTVGEKPVAAEAEPVKPAPAKPVAAKPAETKPPSAGPVAAESERTKAEAAKPVAVKPEGTVSKDESNKKEAAEEVTDEVLTDEVVTDEELTDEELTAEDVVTETTRIAHEGLDSNFFRNVIMAIAVLGTIFFLFYYNRSSRLESSLRKKKRKKGKIFEHNYYEEYEKELAMYGSEETFLDSETDRLYLNYHPDQDSYY